MKNITIPADCVQAEFKEYFSAELKTVAIDSWAKVETTTQIHRATENLSVVLNG